jgi:HD-like signal output (HDOD) protein
MRGVSAIHDDDDARVQLFDYPDRVLDALRSAFHAPDYQPPVLPSVAMDLLWLSRNPDVGFRQVLALIEKDPLVAGKVLRSAQSAFYSPSAGHVRSLHEALVRLGLERLTYIVLDVVTRMKVFRAPGLEQPMEQIRRHSAITAHIARLVCRHVTLYDEYAFLCGLLHDVGLAGGLIVLSTMKPARPTSVDNLWPSLLAVHEEAAGIIANHWQLPPDVTLVLSHHHHCFIEGRVHPVAAAVGIADWIASSLGAGAAGEVGSEAPETETRALGLGAKDLERLRNEAQKFVLLPE